VLVAGTLFFVLLVAALVLPWRRVPLWLWPVLPVGCIGVIALLRDAQGGFDAGLATIYLLPIAWLAYYGKRSHVAAGICAVFLALVVPMLVVGGPEYPPSQWRVVVVVVVGSALISFSLLAVLNREPALAHEIADQALAVRRGARRTEVARERLASLLQAATETAIVGLDAGGTVTFFSAGAEKMFGYATSDVVARLHFPDLFDPDEAMRRGLTIDGLSASGDTGRGADQGSTWTYIRGDGSRRQMSVVVTRRPAPSGSGDGYVLVATDVTEREQLVRERERLLTVQHEVSQVLAEQNAHLKELTRMKDELVTTVSHELRTPLTSIRGFIELLLDGPASSLSREQVRMLEVIDRNSLQLLHVANDLLEDPGLGHGRALRFVDTDLSTLAAEAVEAMRTNAVEQGVHLVLVAGDAVLVRGDPSRLHQLLANLLSNALKFTPAGGHVQVRVRRNGGLARVEVLDDGPGIPPAERTNLFERFYRLASTAEEGIPGTGLGLAIAKAAAEAHNGTIEVVDTPGWSTTFRIHLPAVDSQKSDAPLPPYATPSASSRLTPR
jgi:PAS domain S-box-containing protein